MDLIAAIGSGPVAIDSAIFIYFIERHPRYLPLLRPIFLSLDRGLLSSVTSARGLSLKTRYTPPPRDCPLRRIPHQSFRRRRRRRPAPVDPALGTLALRPRAPRHRRLLPARPLPGPRRLRARRRRDALGERHPLPHPRHAARERRRAGRTWLRRRPPQR